GAGAVVFVGGGARHVGGRGDGRRPIVGRSRVVLQVELHLQDVARGVAGEAGEIALGVERADLLAELVVVKMRGVTQRVRLRDEVAKLVELVGRTIAQRVDRGGPVVVFVVFGLHYALVRSARRLVRLDGVAEGIENVLRHGA